MSNKTKKLRPGRFKWGFLIGALFMAGAALVCAEMVEKTGGADFCVSCHEMDIFAETWRESAHGPRKRGVVSADCADCHAPHTNVIHYLYVKVCSSAKDVSSHLMKKEPDWIKNLERREHYTYESSCKHCHPELVAPGISTKGYAAHRDYQNGETSKTCVSCHSDVGHGNLAHTLKNRLEQQNNSLFVH